jgi:hypothetical protein
MISGTAGMFLEEAKYDVLPLEKYPKVCINVVNT